SLGSDQAHLQKIQTDYDNAVRAKETGQFTASVASVANYGGGGEEGMEGGFRPGYAGGGFGAAMPAPGAGAANPAAAAQLAFMDRQVPDEDIREDKDFIR